MIPKIAILLTDFYKQSHAQQYEPSIKYLTSYYVPRSSRINDWQFVPVIGIQRFIKEYLIDYFEEYFFKLEWKQIEDIYSNVISSTYDGEGLGLDRIKNLHNLGYLPIEINSIEEGTKIPIGCPILEIRNTHPDFPWCVNLIESLMSSQLWYSMVTAMSGYQYRQIVNKYYDETSDISGRSAISDFSLRGTMGINAGSLATMGFLLSFNKTATIPAIIDIHNFYGDSMNVIATGMRSTEHSVACSSFSITGTEEVLIDRLLNQYSTGNFSMVSDSYDYWNLVENILPKFKDKIISRQGTVFIRPDSGDPVENTTKSVFKLWEIFGGEINTKGYKILNSHIRVIYGDAITQVRAKQIYQILKDQGFAADNVVLGAGSFSMLCLMDDQGNMNPYTRDTFNVGIKTVAGSYEFDNELKEMFIFKNPKTDSEHFKKSHKGHILVHEVDGKIKYKDELYYVEAHVESNLLKPVFKNGKLLRSISFTDIRNNLWGGEF